MEMSAATVEHLRDEAYAALCREALAGRLAELAREKATVAGTRPPFGVLARKETRDLFSRSMRDVLDLESALREQLSQVDAIEAKIQPLVRQGVAEYLADASVDYSRLRQILARLHDWERAFRALPEMLLGFARDVRGVRLAASAGRSATHELATLREMAARLESLDRELLIIEQTITETATGSLAGQVKLPALPDFRRVAWVGRLAGLSPEQIVAETGRVEAEVRRFLAEGAEAALARLETSRAVCLQLEDRHLQSYWEQLRAHASAHYVEERDLDDVLAALKQRYIEADLVRRQQEISHDPLTVLR